MISMGGYFLLLCLGILLAMIVAYIIEDNQPPLGGI